MLKCVFLFLTSLTRSFQFFKKISINFQTNHLNQLTMNAKIKLELLPEELLVKIFRYVSTEERAIFNVACVNKYFRKIFNQYWSKRIILNATRESSEKKKSIVEALMKSRRKYQFVKFRVSHDDVKKLSLKKNEEKTLKWVRYLEIICEKFNASITELELTAILNDGCQVLQILGAIKKLAILEVLNLKLKFKKDSHELSFRDYQNQAMEHVFHFSGLKVLYFDCTIGSVCNLFKNCNSLVDFHFKIYPQISENYYFRLLSFFQSTLKCMHIIDSTIDTGVINNFSKLENLDLVTLKFFNTSFELPESDLFLFFQNLKSLKTLDLGTKGHIPQTFFTYIGQRLCLTEIENFKFSADIGIFNLQSYDPNQNFQIQKLKSFQLETKLLNFRKNFMKNILTSGKNLNTLILNGYCDLREGSLFNISKNYPNLEVLELGLMTEIDNNELYHIFRNLKKLKSFKFKFSNLTELDIELFMESELIMENVERVKITLNQTIPTINELPHILVLFPNATTLTIDLRSSIDKNAILWPFVCLGNMHNIKYFTIIFNHTLPSRTQDAVVGMFEHCHLQEVKTVHFPKGTTVVQRFIKDRHKNSITKIY